MKVLELEQGSEEWLKFRQCHLGASDSGTIMRLNPYDSRSRLWEEKVAGIQKEVNSKMKRGSKMEKEARHQYELHTGYAVRPIVGEDEIMPFLSASFDGMTHNLDHAVEIKCGRSAYLEAKEGFIPTYYFAQLQHQMMIANLDQMHYWCWDGKQGILFEVKRDNEFISDLFDEEVTFWYYVINFKQPED